MIGSGIFEMYFYLQASSKVQAIGLGGTANWRFAGCLGV